MSKAVTFLFKPILLIILAGLTGCNFASNDESIGLEDTSASGAVAAVIGGALMAGNPTASTSGTCPLVTSTSGCTNSAGGVSLTFSGCTFGGGSGTRAGYLSMVASGLTCGSAMPASVVQQYSPGSVQVSTNDVTTTFDDWTANLSNFNGDTLPPLSGSGYGVAVGYSSGVPTSMQIARNVHTGSTNYSVVGTPSVAAGSFSGTVTVYDNVLGVIGTSTVSVTYQAGCCFPVSGTISTAFNQSATHPPIAGSTGSLYVGKTETLQFTGCGAAIYTDPIAQAPTALSFTHCY